MRHDDELLTSFQVAVLIGKSPRTVHRLVESGELSYVQKLPGRNGAVLFRRGDVEAFVAELDNDDDKAVS